ncbi:uncharacterized protein LOC135164440 [Diachasmimorpha longicaudata]|uniref:uncharacterized protein LOC135164440 n=1 Tax=Diachasmimorpha longicaudata TaxID=58733 RepID=UPI0030B91459
MREMGIVGSQRFLRLAGLWTAAIPQLEPQLSVPLYNACPPFSPPLEADPQHPLFPKVTAKLCLTKVSKKQWNGRRLVPYLYRPTLISPSHPYLGARGLKLCKTALHIHNLPVLFINFVIN